MTVIRPDQMPALLARQAAQRVPEREVLTRYLTAMEREGTLLPNSAARVFPKVHDPASYPDRTLANLDAYLEGEGKVYVTPRPGPDDAPPLLRALRRFGLAFQDANHHYRLNAADVAERGTPPARAAYKIIVAEGKAEHLSFGGDLLSPTAEPGPDLPKPAAWVKAKNFSSF